jgi:tRNA(fMet)-specific endonuclease VapC
MSRIAKLFRNGRSQAVRLPADLRFEVSQVYIRRDEVTGDVVLSRRPESWQDFFALAKTVDVPKDFLSDRTDAAPQKPVRYLLDTNTVSYIIKGNRPRVRERLLRVIMAEVGVSVITEAELLFGLARRPDATKLKTLVDEFLLRVEVLPWDSGASQQYATIRAALEDDGEPMGNLDLMIAAQAAALDLILVSSDAVFRRVKGLKIQDWSK